MFESEVRDKMREEKQAYDREAQMGTAGTCDPRMRATPTSEDQILDELFKYHRPSPDQAMGRNLTRLSCESIDVVW